jgi:hypothetical protein
VRVGSLVVLEQFLGTQRNGFPVIGITNDLTIRPLHRT